MLNNITLVGRLTRDPELRQTAEGRSIGHFTLANDGLKNKDGSKNTIFIDVDVFGNQADVAAKYLKKGSMCGVTGRLCSRKYVNKQNVEVTAWSISANGLELMNEKTEGQPQPQTAKPAEEQVVAGNAQTLEVSDDELPF